jgi:hypothetical protein
MTRIRPVRKSEDSAKRSARVCSVPGHESGFRDIRMLATDCKWKVIAECSCGRSVCQFMIFLSITFFS